MFIIALLNVQHGSLVTLGFLKADFKTSPYNNFWRPSRVVWTKRTAELLRGWAQDSKYESTLCYFCEILDQLLHFIVPKFLTWKTRLKTVPLTQWHYKDGKGTQAPRARWARACSVTSAMSGTSFCRWSQWMLFFTLKSIIMRGTCLAQSIEHEILDLRVVSLSPILGRDITLKKKV